MMRPSLSKRCMLVVLMELVSLNFFIRPSDSAAAMLSGDRCSSKWTDVSVWCSFMSCSCTAKKGRKEA